MTYVFLFLVWFFSPFPVNRVLTWFVPGSFRVHSGFIPRTKKSMSSPTSTISSELLISKKRSAHNHLYPTKGWRLKQGALAALKRATVNTWVRVYFYSRVVKIKALKLPGHPFEALRPWSTLTLLTKNGHKHKNAGCVENIMSVLAFSKGPLVRVQVKPSGRALRQIISLFHMQWATPKPCTVFIIHTDSRQVLGP